LLTLGEIGPALFGAWRMAHFDAAGMRYFDRSLTGFWRSFWVAALAAPFWAIITASELAQMHLAGDWFRLIAAEAIRYVISWAAFPLAAFYIVRIIGQERNYLGLIVALNWASLLQLSFLLPIVLLINSGILPPSIGSLAGLAAEIAVLVYEWFVIRTALSATGLAAFGFVLLDFLIADFLLVLTNFEAGVS